MECFFFGLCAWANVERLELQRIICGFGGKAQQIFEILQKGAHFASKNEAMQRANIEEF
jgi:hypothetical protein